jgi:integrase
MLVLHTGLRRGKINALHGSDFHLDTTNPFYVVPTAKSKSRKEQPRRHFIPATRRFADTA